MWHAESMVRWTPNAPDFLPFLSTVVTAPVRSSRSGDVIVNSPHHIGHFPLVSSDYLRHRQCCGQSPPSTHRLLMSRPLFTPDRLSTHHFSPLAIYLHLPLSFRQRSSLAFSFLNSSELCLRIPSFRCQLYFLPVRLVEGLVKHIVQDGACVDVIDYFS